MSAILKSYLPRVTVVNTAAKYESQFIANSSNL